MSPIIYKEKEEEEEEEEDMTSNLRVRFRERQRKRLSESIAVNPTPSKKVCPEPTLVPPPVPIPPATAVVVTPKPDEKLSSTDDTAYHEMRRPFVILDNLNKESFKYMTFSHPHPKSTYVFNREEVSKLLKRIPSFTEREPPIQNMGVLFPATQRIPIEIDDNPSRFFKARLSYSTPDIDTACIARMQDYTAFEMAKVVSRPPIFYLFCLSLLFYNNFSTAP